MERQFTATVYIIKDQKVLLISHRKMQKWLPPGGHLDPHETPPEGARREVREETGLEIEFLRQENLWINHRNATSFERPYLCLLEEIPAFNNQPAHQHMDMIYVARPLAEKTIPNHKEIDGLRWFSWQELQALKADEEVFTETLQTIQHILCDFRSMIAD